MGLVHSYTCCDYIVVKETLSGKIMHLSSYILPIICNLNFKAVLLKMVKFGIFSGLEIKKIIKSPFGD